MEEEFMLAHLCKMRTDYANALPAKLYDIELTLLLLREHRWDAAQMHALHRLIHHLHGSGAIYGFASLSAAAQPVDRLVGTLATRENLPTMSETTELAARIDALRVAINHAISTAADMADEPFNGAILMQRNTP